MNLAQGAVERGLCRLDRSPHIVSGALRDLADLLARRGVDGCERSAARRLGPLLADQELPGYSTQEGSGGI